MKEYHKIETLFKFNQLTKRWTNDFYNNNVALLKNIMWTFTEKIDGTNFRIYWNGHKLSYAGRTDNSQFNKEQIDFIDKYLVNEVQETVFEQHFQDKVVTVYGELYGNNIQKGGGLYTRGQGLNFRVFDIEINDVFLEFYDALNLAKSLGYGFVPFAFMGTIKEGINYVMQHYQSKIGEAKLEGIVGKPVGDFRDRFGKRIVVKIKRRDLEKTDGLEVYLNE